jgi:hypothetical protein
MTEEQRQALANRWIEEIITALTPAQRQLRDKDREAIIIEKLGERFDEATKDNPEFRDAVVHRQAHTEMERFLWTRLPKGKFNPNCCIPLDAQNKACAFMGKAKKEHLVAWREVIDTSPQADEYDAQNLRYIESRLQAWGDHPTLLDVERNVFGWDQSQAEPFRETLDDATEEEAN